MISDSPPVLLFTGKGGVGKTTVASATALGLADKGKRVLLVSTDPASNLDEVLAVDLASGDPVEVPGAPGLLAQNIDPEEAARRYRDRVVSPFRGILPDAALANIEEQLSGACTVEVAAFDQFARLLSEASETGFDHLVLDTAPTGHTLRLLELPAAWTGFLDTNTTGTSCLGPLSGLEAERAAYARALDTLRDPTRVRVILVARPDGASLREAERAAAELGTLGIRGQGLVVNAVPTGLDPSDPIARRVSEQAREALAGLPDGLAEIERIFVPLSDASPIGVEGLRRFAGGESHTGASQTDTGPVPDSFRSLDELLDDLESPDHCVVLTMGKGGVGKTKVALAVAEGLARRGHRVHLTTTDPAAHAMETAEGLGHLRVSRIDPDTETRSYTEEVLSTAAQGLDSAGRALLEEDLRSPCTEEIAVFRAFAAAVAGGEDEIVVIDTAPTGHTLLLLDAAEAYHREVLRKPGNSPEAVRSLLPRLRDPAFARVLLVTLPQATPVHEAARLQSDLERAGIHPFAWVVNQCLTGLELSDPLLLRSQADEARFLCEVGDLSHNATLLNWNEAGTPASPTHAAPSLP